MVMYVHVYIYTNCIITKLLKSCSLTKGHRKEEIHVVSKSGTVDSRRGSTSRDTVCTLIAVLLISTAPGDTNRNVIFSRCKLLLADRRE